MGRPRLAPDGVAQPITVKLDPTLLERLDRAARAEAVNRSELVREMLADGLDRLEAGAAPPRRLMEPIPTPITTPVSTRLTSTGERLPPGPAVY